MIGTRAGLAIGLIDEGPNRLRHARPVSGGCGVMLAALKALFGASWG